MVLTRIRQAGSLKPQVKVGKCGVDKRGYPHKVSNGALRKILHIYRGVIPQHLMAGACSWDTRTKRTSSSAARG